ncbi:MAG: CvpA family protein [Chloroflexota bacterium]|nr:CvpA family protein [Chloroflexota bacterium]
MVPLETVFIGLMLFFGIVGALRGWAKELLVTFSVILARFVELVLVKYMPVVKESLAQVEAAEPKTWFYLRLGIFIVIVFFGYATTTISAALGIKTRKDKLQDTLLGFFLGGINGFLVVGMVWGFLEHLGYVQGLWGITAPTEKAQALIPYLPLNWLSEPELFIAVAVSFAFVLIVFI